MSINKTEIYGYIYTIRNKINNKLYIGQTTDNFDRRYSRNVEKYTSNKHLKNSIKKYGLENFEIDKEFDIAYSQEELNKLECLYINIYNTTNQKYGYNKMYGGSNGKPTAEALKHMSEARKGIKFTEEAKRNMSEARKGRFTGGEHPMAEKVVCITTNEIFDSAKEGADKYLLSNSNILACCKGRLKSVGKLEDGQPLVWMEYQEYLNTNEYEINEKIKQADNRVICINTKQIFENTVDASNKTKIDRADISKCCNGKMKGVGRDKNGNKLMWMHYRDYISLQEMVI